MGEETFWGISFLFHTIHQGGNDCIFSVIHEPSFIVLTGVYCKFYKDF